MRMYYRVHVRAGIHNPDMHPVLNGRFALSLYDIHLTIHNNYIIRFNYIIIHA